MCSKVSAGIQWCRTVLSACSCTICGLFSTCGSSVYGMFSMCNSSVCGSGIFSACHSNRIIFKPWASSSRLPSSFWSINLQAFLCPWLMLFSRRTNARHDDLYGLSDRIPEASISSSVTMNRCSLGLSRIFVVHTGDVREREGKEGS